MRPAVRIRPLFQSPRPDRLDDPPWRRARIARGGLRMKPARACVPLPGDRDGLAGGLDRPAVKVVREGAPA